MPRSAAATPPPTAYQRAIRRLARRDHSVAELRRALLERGHEPAEVEAALERLRRERYLDDAGFAERFARSRMAHQGLRAPPRPAGTAPARRRPGDDRRRDRRGAARGGRAAGPRRPRPPLLAPARRGRARPAASPPLGVPAAPGLRPRPRAGPAVRPLAAVERRPRGARAPGPGRGPRGGRNERANDAVKTADEIRSAFLRYFEERGHRVVKSSPLVPQDDPTLLFANAGMNQFKDVFLGREKRDYTRAASSQKCVRAGGKHNDLENVGVTARHHTFFEMLGNFSFGDYFKKDAIEFGWDFLTRDLGLPKDRLKVTIFRGEDGVPRDGEAHGLWKAHVPRSASSSSARRTTSGPWATPAPAAPAPRSTTSRATRSPAPRRPPGAPASGVECECDRWLEIWNLVFMQYDRDENGALDPLPAPCVDTGMGLERVAAVVQGKLSNYDTDLFTPLLAAVGRRAGKAYGDDAADDVSMRVVADHLRAMTFLIADGVLPGNEGRGYVLRKIMRRAIRHGQKLGIEGAFLQQLTHDVVARMKAAFPELVSHEEAVSRVVAVEEERFATTIRQAIGGLRAGHRGRRPPARRRAGSPDRRAEAFRLYDTYGLPLDFLDELAARPGPQRRPRRLRARARRAAGAGPAVEQDGRGEGRPRLHEARRGGREDGLPRLRGALGGGRARPRGAEGRGARPAARRRRGGPRRSRPHSLLRHVGRPGRRPGGDRLRRLGGGGHRHHEPPARPARPPGARHPRGLRARHGGPGGGRRRAPRRRHAPPHGHAPAPRRPARDARAAREAGGQPRRPRPAPLRLQPLRARRARASCGTSRTG